MKDPSTRAGVMLRVLWLTPLCCCWHFRSSTSFPCLHCPSCNPFASKEDASSPTLPEQGSAVATPAAFSGFAPCSSVILIFSFFLCPQALTSSVKCVQGHGMHCTSWTICNPAHLRSKFKRTAFETHHSHTVELFHTIMRTIHLLQKQLKPDAICATMLSPSNGADGVSRRGEKYC